MSLCWRPLASRWRFWILVHACLSQFKDGYKNTPVFLFGDSEEAPADLLTAFLIKSVRAWKQAIRGP